MEAYLLTDDLLNLISNSEEIASLEEKRGLFVVDDTVGISLLFAALFKKKPGKYHIIASNLYNAQRIANFLASLIGSDNVLFYPCDDLLRTELLASSKEMLAQRLYVLSEVNKNNNRIIISHASSLLMPLPLKVEFLNSTFHLKVGETISLEKLKVGLTEAGYYHVNKVDQSLQFASRGDILDIFSVNYLKPIRIEFFGDEIDCIHFFDIATQESTTKIDEAIIIPATDLLISNDELIQFKNNIDKQLIKDKELLGSEIGEYLSTNVYLDYDQISNRIYTPRAYKYYRYIKKYTSSFIDYFDSDLTFIVNEKQFFTTCDFIVGEARNYFSDLFSHGKLLSHLEMYLDVGKVIKNEKHLLYGNEFVSNPDDIEFKTNPLIFSKTNLSNLKLIISSYLETNDKVILALANKQQFETIKNVLEEIEYEETSELNLPRKRLGITIFSLEEGFELPEYKIAVLSAKELFGFQNKSSRFMTRFKEAHILKNYEDLKPGDYVVHEYYGIGQFMDVETINVNGLNRDFMHIKYASDEMLYVPLSQFRLVRKYSGREGAAPHLSKLGTNGWEKTKAKIKERINLLADRLFKLYSERARVKGFAFPLDDELQRQFENEFPYELTPDQLTSLNEIKKDMENETAMDRLLCGDVGFGKTEVAFRAAFKAMLAGKQVAILCPTTLLARQHYENAVERFSSFGVKVALLSRLVPQLKQKQYIEDIKNGNINLIIGTHTILTNRVVFKDLGLLIIDEEQRFGVEQKEMMKEIKTNMDVLSLSATPIPRTLQLSLIGVRPVSLINTPPTNRSPIQTYVAPYNDSVARELIERELARNGQVFYVHNDISTIGFKADHIKRAIPTCSVGYVHGKMEKEQIEDTMMRFYSGEINVLVATSIIENGIDIPNANLLIVEDADCFGLSQLYQIKGRVGRGDRIAYAYLFYRERKELSDTANKRLKAIQDFTELGSGYKISQRDLMIRGAGDILGPEQAGFIDSVGLELYLKMLNEVMEEKKNGVVHESPQPVKLLKLNAYIPGEYASKEDKIQLYQQIESSNNLAELSSLKKKVRDMYGKMPDEVDLLFKKRALDIKLTGPEFARLSETTAYLNLSLSKKFSSINGIGSPLFEALEPFLDSVNVSYIAKVLEIRIKKSGNYFKLLGEIVNIITDLYSKYNK